MPTSSPAEVFISYSYKDEELFKQFEKYLTVLARNGKIKTWHGRQIPPGEEWKKVIDEHIKSADFVLLLVSVDFLVSEYCFNVEFKAARQRHAIRATRIIPIILHPSPWEKTIIKEFQVLPRDGKPIAISKDDDTAEAFLNVTNSLWKLIERDAVPNRIKLITITIQTSQNEFHVEDFTGSLRDDVGVNLERIEIAVPSGSNKVMIEGEDQDLRRIINALKDAAFRRQLLGGVEAKSITYIQDDYIRYIPLEPAEPPEPGRHPAIKYVLLLAAIVVGIIVKNFFVSWSQPQEDYIHSPTPTPSATSLPTPSVMPSPTPTMPTGVQITITKVPVNDPVGGRNKKGKIAGKVSGLKSNDYSVVIYALTVGGTWHVQPTTDKPRTDIKPDGTWEAEIQLGSRYAALVVPPNFNPPNQITSLPTQLRGIVAATEVEGSSQTTGESK